MIIGEYVLEYKGNNTYGKRGGMGIGMKIDDVRKSGENLEVEYSFQADYREQGKILVRGVLIAKENDSKKILDGWAANKQLPEDFAKNVYTAINYSGCSNGTLVAKVLGHTAPLIPPKVHSKS
ncbi:MAG TPA: hypothetical protein VLD37_03765 [Candidatus Bilamarchaeum sp.]|nr:hypothetical protein [Candidatus Bilamarchaeum sp.]